MKTIRIADATLRAQTEGAGATLSFKEKLEIAKELDRLGISAIETAPITDEKADTLFLRTISSLVKKSAISCPVGTTLQSVETAWEAVSGATRPRLIVSLPVSTVQMEYACGKKPAQMLDLIGELVKACAGYTPDVEFAAQDATRGEPEFLSEAIKRAVAAGATTMTLCDSAGTMLPDEFAAFITGTMERVRAMRGVTVSVQCSDEMGMAAACAFASIAAGAEEVKTAACGAGMPGLETVANIFRARGDSLGIRSELDMTGINRAVKRIIRLASSERSATSAFAGDFIGQAPGTDITLDSAADINAVERALRSIGYDLSGEDLAKVFEEFGRIAAKKSVSARELDVIVASSALQVPSTYKIISYIINSGNVINATAHIHLEKDGRRISGLMTGDGPIDAAFLAVEQIVGRHYELDDFQIQAVTEGREAMGSALVKLRTYGRLFSGHGVSTDIIGAAIRAYIDAINKIVYEERSGQ